MDQELHTENWRVLDSRDEPLGRRLILLVDWDSAKIINGTGYKIYTGLSEGTFKVLSDPEREIRGRASRERPQAVDTGTGGRLETAPPPGTGKSSWGATPWRP